MEQSGGSCRDSAGDADYNVYHTDEEFDRAPWPTAPVRWTWHHDGGPTRCPAGAAGTRPHAAARRAPSPPRRSPTKARKSRRPSCRRPPPRVLHRLSPPAAAAPRCRRRDGGPPPPPPSPSPSPPSPPPHRRRRPATPRLWRARARASGFNRNEGHGMSGWSDIARRAAPRPSSRRRSCTRRTPCTRGRSSSRRATWVKGKATA